MAEANGRLNGYTPIESRIVRLLSDGRRHKRSEVMGCLEDPLASYPAILPHISNIRKKLPAGEDIVCIDRDRTRWYQHVRLLCSANDGRT